MATTVFSQAQIESIVQSTIAPVTDATHTHAIVGTISPTGAQVVLGFQRVSGSAEWQIAGVAEHDWNGDNKVGASVLLKW